MTTVRDYIGERGWSADELAARLGVKVETVERRMSPSKGDMPGHWIEALERGEQVTVGRPRKIDDAELEPDNGRVSEVPPQRPTGARVRPDEPPKLAGTALDFASVEQAVTSLYRTAGDLITPSDPALGLAISSYAEPAGVAWAKWAAANPRLAAWLEKMMVGTPAGEVIGVHVGIAFAYFMARSEQSRAIRDAAAAADDDAAEQGFDAPVATAAAG